MVDEPTAYGHFGGDVAAPVFASVTANVLRAMNVAPDSTITNIVIPDNPLQESL
jgi:cell division protein FtsI (penicillin-binding protein 3)